MTTLRDKEKRNYSAKTTQNRHLNGHPDYQSFGTWLVGTVPCVGTPAAAGSLSISRQYTEPGVTNSASSLAGNS